MATGGIIIAIIMLLVFPVLIMFGGAIWSALMGRLLVDDADQHANTVADAANEASVSERSELASE